MALAEGGVDVARFFLALAAILVAAKLLGELAERIGQPAVLGELVAGVLLGGSVLGIVPAGGAPGELIHVLAELGVLLLLFEIGLETDLREMFRVGAGLARRSPWSASWCRSRSGTPTGLYAACRCRRRRSHHRRHLRRRHAHRHLGRDHGAGALRPGADGARPRRGSSSAPRSSTTCSGWSS